MLFTRAERYALRSALCLAGKPRRAMVTLDELSREQGVSKQFLANILSHLTAAGLLHAYRGVHGGYSLNRQPDRITVADIWDAIRGGDAPINCVVDAAECPSSSFCPIRKLFEGAFGELHGYLEKCTVQRLTSDLNKLPKPTTCGSIQRTTGRDHRIPHHSSLPILQVGGAVGQPREEPQPSPKRDTVPLSQYCWEFYSRNGKVPAGCMECIVHRSGTRRCYELSRLPVEAGHRHLFCKKSCAECEYFQETYRCHQEYGASASDGNLPV